MMLNKYVGSLMIREASHSNFRVRSPFLTVYVDVEHELLSYAIFSISSELCELIRVS